MKRTTTRPVNHATLTIGGATSYTDAQGTATVMANGSHTLTVSAGDTLIPISAALP